MQFISILALLASATVAFAQDDTNNGNICKAEQKQACCETSSDGVLGGLLGGSCELNILGENCAGQSACCQVDGSGAILGASCQPVLSI